MPNCPEITKISHDKGFVDGHLQTLEFVLEISHDGTPPDKYEWDWGDEARNTTTTEAQATHTYVRPGTDDAPVTVTVKAIGPGDCETTATVSPMLFGTHTPPPPLPHMAIMDEYLVAETDTTVTYEFDVRTFSRPLFPNYEWDWGDGSAKTRTSAPTSSHTFNKPVGADQDLIITVSGWNEQWECETYSKFPFKLKAMECPTIDQINQEETGRTIFVQEKKFTLDMTTNGISVNEFEWEWGDGSANTLTTVPQATHTFKRPVGTSGKVEMRVSAKGLGNCQPVKGAEVPLDSTCPNLLRVEAISKPEDVTDTTFQVHATAVFEEDFQSDSLKWDWGDGTTSDDGANSSHTYARPAGDSEQRTITVTGSGPNGCTTTATTQITVPGVCPAIASIKIDKPEAEPTTQTVHFEVTISPASIKPDTFEWTLEGLKPEDSTTVTTEGPTLTHQFTRPNGDGENRVVKVKANGPDSCVSERETEVFIPGVCPKLELSYTLGEAKGTKQTVNFAIKVDGPTPESFSWDWGDLTTETGASLTATHEYDRLFGTAVANYSVKVRGLGPDSCEASSGVTVEVPPIPCPEITSISKEETLTGLDVQAVFTIEVSGEAAPASYEWKWGDETPNTITNELSLTHVFLRPAGKSKTYTVTVTVLGPGDCSSSKDIEIDVPGVCPRVTGLQYVLEPANGDQQQANFTAFVEMGEPSSYTWHWGDGSDPETTSEPQANHMYKRETGRDVKYEARVIANGPDDCTSDGNVTVVLEDIPCPELVSMAIEVTAKQPDTVSARATTQVKSGKPAKFTWNWGDGTTTDTTSPTATHTYKRPENELTCPVSVTAFGPESCESSASSQVVLPGKEAPVIPLWCRLIKWIAAYLIAVTAGILVICYVDEVCDAADGGLLILTSVMILLSMASVAYWFMNGRGACPPKACDWYAVGWSSFFTMTAAGFYSLGCCGGNSWIASIVFFLLGAFMGYMWFTKCAVKSRATVFLLYVAVFVIASLISIFLVADAYLQCLA